MKLNPQSFFKTEDGAYLYYREHGEGTPLLMMHGWSLSCGVYERARKDLAGTYRVITPDFRGHGYSSKILTGHSVEQYARDMKQLIDFLGIDKFVLCGWSMSVAVALRFTELFGTDSLLGIVLIDGSPHPFTDEPWNSHQLSGYNMDGLIMKMNRLTASPEEESRRSSEVWFKDREKHEDAISFFAGEIRKTPAWISYAIYSDYMMQDLTRAMENLTIPALILVPESHRLRGIHEQGLIAGAELRIFEAGHALFYEEPESFCKVMKQFLIKCLIT